MSTYTLSKLDGSALVALPPPLRGLSRSAALIGSTLTTLAGNRIVHRVATKRDWELAWERLPDSMFTLIEEFWLGTNGRGPYLFTEPARTPATVNLTGLDDSVQLLGFHTVRLNLAEV